MTTTIAVPTVQGPELRRARLATMKRRATALLLGVTAVFLVTAVWGTDVTWVRYVHATSEAAMVGGLADWFAVVALFRHPIGIPIPHTAIIVERKDQFAETLGEFIGETFLTPETITARVRNADVVRRSAEWLQQPANAQRVAGELLDGSVRVADLVRDEDVHRVLEGVVRDRVDAVPLAPLLGRGLAFVIRDGRHQQALDVALRELDRYLADDRDDLRRRLGEQSPWWLPGAAEDRIFERLIDGARTLIAEMLDDRGHHLRRRFEERLVRLADELQTSPEYLARGEQLKHEVLATPEVRAWATDLWTDLKTQLRAQAEAGDSPLRTRLTALVAATGTRLADDPVLAGKLERSIETGVAQVVERFHGQIGDLVSTTVARWDAAETADRLELLLGPDLQFIRINGTVVGALAGLVLYTISQALG
jgi:uncharacterized membrane-anchored protein YjiN (DUF445 family)